jgi:DNA-directed RNA polymerase subunit RPC12/RpoP
MNKYKIEGNIDFFAELYKSLDTEDNLDEDNTCLITNQPLTDKYIQLQCGHKFNYIPLFLDIKNHKQKFNRLEGHATHLNTNEIRCPYCRYKHYGILPYYEEFGYEKINGVNHFDKNFKGYSNISYKQCDYLTPNSKYDPSGNLPVESNKNNIGNVKFFLCYSSGTKINIENSDSELNNDNKCYCYKHQDLVIKAHKKKLLQKEKEKKLLEKNKLKEEKEIAKKALQEEKIKAKEEKKQNKGKKATDKSEAKSEAKSEENIVIGSNNFTGCTEIIKSGANKGKPCGCKIFMDSICSRHFKIKNNIITNNI